MKAPFLTCAEESPERDSPKQRLMLTTEFLHLICTSHASATPALPLSGLYYFQINFVIRVYGAKVHELPWSV